MHFAHPPAVCPASVMPAVVGFSSLRHAGGGQCEHIHFIRHLLMTPGITQVHIQLLTIRLGALSSSLLSEFQIFFLFKKLFPPSLLVSFYAFTILSTIYPCIYYIPIYLFTIFYQPSASPLCICHLARYFSAYLYLLSNHLFLRLPTFIHLSSMYQPSTNVSISYLPTVCLSVHPFIIHLSIHPSIL